jgi:hypothetical protein
MRIVKMPIKVIAATIMPYPVQEVFLERLTGCERRGRDKVMVSARRSSDLSREKLYNQKSLSFAIAVSPLFLDDRAICA